MRIKIVFTIPNFITAGSGREMFNIIERLDPALFEPHILTAQEGGGLAQEVVEKGYPLIVHPFTAENESGIVGKLRKAHALGRFFRSAHFDIWQSFGWSSDFTEALVARTAGAKYCYVKKNMNWDRKAWKIKSLLSHKVVLRNTTLQHQNFNTSFLRQRGHLIQGGVDITTFHPLSDPAPLYRTTFAIPEGGYLLCCIAQMVPVKGQDILIRALQEVPNAYLVIAGKAANPSYAAQLQEMVQTLGLADRVFFPGFVTDVNQLLNEADLFILPTTLRSGHEEGCPVALLEAMAAGCCCIATDVAGSNDLVQHDQTGLLCKPENVENLAQTLKAALANQAHRLTLGQNASERVQTQFTLDREAKDFVALYQTL